MDRLDVIEECRGQGRVCWENGEFIRDTKYDLQVLQEVHEMPSEGVPGLKRIEGTIELGELDLHLVGEPLVLHLEDGRRLDFFYTDLNGTIANRGGQGLYRPEAV